VTLLFVGIIALAAYSNEMFLYPTQEQLVAFLIDTGILTCLFLILCRDKTNGKIKWNWGAKGKWF
jgi:membrane protein implicated in regulation of membrane protease activity